MRSRFRARALLIAALVIFGTNGVAVRLSGMPPAAIAVARGIIGAATLIVVFRVRGERLSCSGIAPATLAHIVAAGACIGANWVLLFEALRTTSVAIATTIYYLAPALVVAASPLILREKPSVVRMVCVIVSFAGAGLITGFDGAATASGVARALSAAAFYASAILLNATFSHVDYRVRTLIQIAVAGIVSAPYALATGAFAEIDMGPRTLIYLLCFGILYTGVAYACYVAAFSHLGAQEVSILSYLDPVVAVLCSALVLAEPLSWASILGAVLIIASSIVSEARAPQADSRKDA